MILKFEFVCRLLLALSAFLLSGCQSQSVDIKIDKLFTLMPAAHTGIDFENRLSDEKGFNVFKYRNFYNGGGVAIADVNGDSLPDVYLTSNAEGNRLYLNRGNFQFEDVTRAAGVGGSHNWSTGACFADVNADGLLDLYVCNSGNIDDDTRANELFINQGTRGGEIPVFKEAGAEYGADDKGFSTHAAFFDYDRDGDLDLYVMNNAFRPLSTFDLSENLRTTRDHQGGGDRFYRNDDGKFVDISDAAGIYGSVIAFGLGLSVSDLNDDGWLDIYIANDFFERDYLYLNNQDGTFSETLEASMRHVSLSSMGCDAADMNGDGMIDVFTTDMLPEDDVRLKTTFTFEDFDFNEKKIAWGYYHQLSQNALQLNNGTDAAGQPLFTDVALYAGVAATDWSWCPLLLDLDLDARKDIFVTNGIYRDVTDQDYLDFLREKANMRKIMEGERIDIPELISKIPSTPLPNYAYRYNGDSTYANLAAEWGLDTRGFSNGAAYGDLDGDGDLDLVVNNLNQQAFVYRNESDSLRSHRALAITLAGQGKNPFAIGARVTLHHTDGSMQVQEQLPMRGFQSSMDYKLIFGLGAAGIVDSITVRWPEGAETVTQTDGNSSQIHIDQSKAESKKPNAKAKVAGLFEEFSVKLEYQHQENNFVDFKREPLLPQMLSREGPGHAVGDVNGDGRDDLYLGGAKAQPAELYLQSANGTFTRVAQPDFEKDKVSEDVDACFFDADGDGNLDLYVVSGGTEYGSRAPALQDRLYLNNGSGTFTRAKLNLPRKYVSGACVAPHDFDADGDIDLFVGSRSLPWKYGLPPASQLLQNDGSGSFDDVAAELAPDLDTLGMVTDAYWIDHNRDGRMDLAIAGDWMPITILQQDNGKFQNITASVGLDSSNGWWQAHYTGDFDGDGNTDLLAANIGENHKLRASRARPVSMYVGDFDGNRLVETIVVSDKQGVAYPLPLRSDILRSLPKKRTSLPTHKSYAGSPIESVLSDEQLKSARVLKSYGGAHSVFWGREDGTFQAQKLPSAVQLSTAFAIATAPGVSNGFILAGNFSGATTQLGAQDASYGSFLTLAPDSRSWKVLPMQASGLQLRGDVRNLIPLRHRSRDILLVARNNASVLFLGHRW